MRGQNYIDQLELTWVLANTESLLDQFLTSPENLDWSRIMGMVMNSSCWSPTMLTWGTLTNQKCVSQSEAMI